jgi:hypothetical protein
MPGVCSGHGHPELSASVQVMVTGFGSADVEPLQRREHRTDHRTLLLQRGDVVQQHVQT